MDKSLNKLIKFDPTKAIEKMRRNQETKIVVMAICKLFPNEKIEDTMLTVAMERVEFYSLDIYTIRYKGEVILRRYVEDLMGERYRYESPIFD